MLQPTNLSAFNIFLKCRSRNQRKVFSYINDAAKTYLNEIATNLYVCIYSKLLKNKQFCLNSPRLFRIYFYMIFKVLFLVFTRSFTDFDTFNLIKKYFVAFRQFLTFLLDTFYRCFL